MRGLADERFTVARSILRVGRPVLRPVLRPLSVRYPRATARAVAPITRALSRIPGATSQKAATYLVRHSPRDVRAIRGRYLGLTFDLDLRDNVQRDLFYLGRYEPELVKFVLRELQPGDVFVDVGAHIGSYSLPAARRVGRTGRVIAFEPDPDTASVLARNRKANGITSLTIASVGLGSHRSTTSLRGSESEAYLPEDAGVRTIHGKGPIVGEVDIVPFDDWATQNSIGRIDVIKIDVEGNEYAVLTGMLGSLQTYSPRLLIIEVVAGHLRRAGVTPLMLEKLLRQEGYRPDGPSVTQIGLRRVGLFWPNAVLRRAG
jgi:FkbM family methyltransferase